MTTTETRIIRAARAWWRQRRPVGWSETLHLACPDINTCSECEHRLAGAVGDYVESIRRAASIDRKSKKRKSCIAN